MISLATFPLVLLLAFGASVSGCGDDDRARQGDGCPEPRLGAAPGPGCISDCGDIFQMCASRCTPQPTACAAGCQEGKAKCLNDCVDDHCKMECYQQANSCTSGCNDADTCEKCGANYQSCARKCDAAPECFTSANCAGGFLCDPLENICVPREQVI